MTVALQLIIPDSFFDFRIPSHLYYSADSRESVLRGGDVVEAHYTFFAI